MPLELKPGSSVSVKLTKTPTNAAAAKTLSRLFAKDRVNKRVRRQRKKLLAAAIEVRRRGGRPWEVRSKAPAICRPKPGDSCNLAVTTDVIGDLKSVGRFVEIKAGR